MKLIVILSHFVQNFFSLLRYGALLEALITMLAFWGLSMGSAYAQLASLPHDGVELKAMDVLYEAPMGLTLAQVQSGQAGSFVSHNSLQIFKASWGKAMWLRLRFTTLPNQSGPAKQAGLALPRPFIDVVRLYTPSANPGDPWTIQQAGDTLAPHTWTQRMLYPKFKLPAPVDGAWRGGQELVVYLQIDHNAPALLQLELSDAAQMLDRDLLSLILYSMCLGAILMTTVLSAATAMLHRDGLYAWYSAYTLGAGLAALSHSGLAIHLLWPIGGQWPSTAIFCFLLLCCACLMQFALTLNITHMPSTAIRWLLHTQSGACVVLALSFSLFSPHWREFYFASLTLMVTVVISMILMMRIGIRAGQRLARVWMLTYVPLFITVGLSILDGIGVLPWGYWSFSLGIYAASLEVLILGLALQWFARERHGERERMKVLASVDPLTGFVTSEAFQSQLLRDWQSKKDRNRHLAVAYIQLQTRAKNEEQYQHLLTRCVRILRSASGAQDVVARLDKQMLALLIRDVPMGDALNQRLSRIVALGLMPDSGKPDLSILQFRIAATTRERYFHPVPQLDLDLRALIAQPQGWGSKPIRYIELNDTKQTGANDVNNTDLDYFWNNALGDEMAAQTATTAPSPLQ